MKKRILALCLCLLMTLALAACGKEDAPAPADKPAEGETTLVTGIPATDLKIGLILVGDPVDAYNANHIAGMEAAMKKLNLAEGQLITKTNIGEDAGCDTAIRELVEAGCQIIFSNSFGHESYMVEVAPEFPEVQFCAATGVKSATDELENTHNYFAEVYQARYLSGIAAGMKTATGKLGYVAAKPYAEVISGYTAFYLGAKSVNPNVEMYVNYTNEWSDAGKEATNAKALIDLGCDVLGQHSDTSAPATTAEAAGVWAVGYNDDMIPAAPNAALCSARINWGVYYEYALDCMLTGDAIAADWWGGLDKDAVYLSDLNEAIVAPGTAEAIATAEAALKDGSLQVFAGPLTDVDGNVVVAEGKAFIENEKASAPSWDKIIQGINVLS